MAPAIRAFTLALRAAATCPASPSCPQDDQCSTVSNGVTLQVSCATDFYGGDLQLTQASTLASCIKSCATTTGCNAASYVNGNCYLKSTLNQGSANPNVVGVAVLSRTAPTPAPASGLSTTCPASFACPANDGCSFTDSGRTFTLACGVDFYGGDFANQWATSYQDCSQACSRNPQCVAASFTGGSGEGQCYLKSAKNSGVANDNVNAVYIATPTAQSSSSATSSTLLSSSTISSSTIPSSSSVVASSSAISTSSLVASSTLSSSSTPSSSSSLVTSSSSSSSSSTPTPTPSSSSSTPAVSPSSSTPRPSSSSSTPAASSSSSAPAVSPSSSTPRPSSSSTTPTPSSSSSSAAASSSSATPRPSSSSSTPRPSSSSATPTPTPTPSPAPAPVPVPAPAPVSNCWFLSFIFGC